MSDPALWITNFVEDCEEIFRLDISSHHKATLVVMSYLSDDGETLRSSLSDIGDNVGVTARQAQRNISDMVKAGVLLVIEKRPGLISSYRFKWRSYLAHDLESLDSILDDNNEHEQRSNP